MNLSFYSGAIGASSQQTKLDVIANNIANVNTVGFKTQNTGFVDLLYANINAAEGENTNLKTGSGVRCEKTDLLFTEGAYQPTGDSLDFAIKGRGFFAVADPVNGQVRYTRDGSFKASLRDGEFYMVTAEGDFVLDKNEEPIVLSENQETMEHEKPGIFDFQTTEGLRCMGDNVFVTGVKNGEKTVLDDSHLVSGYLEFSNVNLASEMSKLIEAQRSYQLSLRMIQTSDDVENTVNNLR